MIEKIETGGPAFPCHPEIIPHRDHDFAGMTLRDYFAAKAMQTLIACAWDRSGDTNHIIDDDGRVSLHLRSYEHADAMLKAREVKNGQG